jgi:hypothetical protein
MYSAILEKDTQIALRKSEIKNVFLDLFFDTKIVIDKDIKAFSEKTLSVLR